MFLPSGIVTSRRTTWPRAMRSTICSRVRGPSSEYSPAFRLPPTPLSRTRTRNTRGERTRPCSWRRRPIASALAPGGMTSSAGGASGGRSGERVSSSQSRRSDSPTAAASRPSRRTWRNLRTGGMGSHLLPVIEIVLEDQDRGHLVHRPLAVATGDSPFDEGQGGHRLHVLARAHALQGRQAGGEGRGLVGERHPDPHVAHVEPQVTHGCPSTHHVRRRLHRPSIAVDHGGSLTPPGGSAMLALSPPPKRPRWPSRRSTGSCTSWARAAWGRSTRASWWARPASSAPS